MRAARPLASVVALALVALAHGPASAEATVDVLVGDSFFSPQTATVQVGDTVRWTQDGNLPHSVTAEDGSFDSHPACGFAPNGCMRDGDTYTRTFTQPGLVPYYCKVHGSPGGNGHAGVIKVVDETGVVPTSIVRLAATRDGATVIVGGAATFGGQTAVTVGTYAPGDSTQPAALGYDLLRAQISQPEPKTGDLVFELQLAELPATGGLPEAARYTWDFAVNPGTGNVIPFEIDGKLTDVVRRQTTRVPAFVLRGDCTSANNVITCTDVATLDATMDPATDRITVTLPRALLEAHAKVPVAGTAIEPATICEGISSKAAAYFSACGGAAGPATGDVIAQDSEVDVYRVAGRTVRLGIVPAGSAPAYTTSGTLADDGSFSGSLDVSGLAPGSYDVVARACFGTNCGTASVPITI